MKDADQSVQGDIGTQKLDDLHHELEVLKKTKQTKEQDLSNTQSVSYQQKNTQTQQEANTQLSNTTPAPNVTKNPDIVFKSGLILFGISLVVAIYVAIVNN